MLSINYIKHFASDNACIAYLLIILGMIIEGEIVVVIAGIFTHLGSLNIFFVVLSMIIGASIKSFVGYNIGFYLQKYHSNKNLILRTEGRVNYFLPNFIKKPFLSIFLSRFLILGMHLFALIFSGYKKIKVSQFIKAEGTSLLVWGSAMISIGYFFSLTAMTISKDIRKFLGIILIFFLLFFVLEKFIAFVIELFETKEVNE